MTRTDANLAGFLDPGEFADFARARDSYKPYLATGRPDRVAGYFSIDDFAALLNQTSLWMPDRLEVMLDSSKVPAQNYFTQLPLFNGVRYRLENASLQKLLDMGASVILNDIDALRPGLKRLRRMIGDFTGGKVENNLYYSQRGRQAFAVHFDTHDVYAFQVAGEKRWQVYQQVCRHPIRHIAFLGGSPEQHERAKGPVSMDITLKPGDFLYLPAGYYHQAICTESVSLHLSFSAIEMIGLDVISELFERAVAEEFFRTPIARSMRRGNQPVAGYLKALAEHLGRLMADEAFVRSIGDRIESYPYPADDLTVKKEWGASKRSP